MAQDADEAETSAEETAGLRAVVRLFSLLQTVAQNRPGQPTLADWYTLQLGSLLPAGAVRERFAASTAEVATGEVVAVVGAGQLVSSTRAHNLIIQGYFLRECL